MKTILIVDDEFNIRDVIASYLTEEGFQVVQADKGLQALEYIQSATVHLVILDLMLPDVTGEQLCQNIRQFTSIPIIMLTAKASENQRIHGLSIGADDYITKPFSPREVVARVKALFRRTDDKKLLADQISYGAGKLVIDALKNEVRRCGERINLTPNEFSFLVLMARQPQRHFSREQLIELCFGFDYEGDTRTIDQHIKNLRHKIEDDPKQPEFLLTVYGKGYRFSGEERS